MNSRSRLNHPQGAPTPRSGCARAPQPEAPSRSTQCRIALCPGRICAMSRTTSVPCLEPSPLPAPSHVCAQLDRAPPVLHPRSPRVAQAYGHLVIPAPGFHAATENNTSTCLSRDLPGLFQDRHRAVVSPSLVNTAKPTLHYAPTHRASRPVG